MSLFSMVLVVGYFSHPFSFSFDLSNHPLDSWYFPLFLFLFKTILSNARSDSSKLEEKGHKVMKSPTAIAGSQVLSRFDLDQVK